jgi:hypothetical protein
MTSMNAESVILKTDRQGRVRTPLAQREALLDAFECSGLSGMKFAAPARGEVSQFCQLGAAAQTSSINDSGVYRTG